MPRIKPTRFVFQAVQLVRPCEVVAYRITEAIRSGDVKVGERLPSEQSLSEQLGVSRPTLREATKLLEFLGIVEKKAEWQIGMDPPSPGRSARHGASCRGDRGTAKAHGKTSVRRTRGRGET